MGELPNTAPKELTILDMEASLEHLTRGTVRNVDVLLVVAEPYYRSLESAGRIVPLARELGLERVWVIANKARNARDEAAIREYCTRRGFDVIGAVPFDECITEADNQGKAFLDFAPSAAAVAAIGAVAESIIDRMTVESTPCAT